MSLLIQYLRPEWPRTFVLGLLLLAGIGLQLTNPQIAKSFIDAAQQGEPFEQLIKIAGLFLGVALLTHLATVAETYVAEDLGWRTTNALRADLTTHVLALDDAFHAEHTSGELIERIDGDVSAIADFFARFVVQVLGNGIFLIGVLLLLYHEDWRIGGLLTACVLIAVLFMTQGGRFVTTRSRLARQAAGDLSAYLGERLDGLADLKSSGADDYAMHRLGERLQTRFGSSQRSVFAGSIFNSTVSVLFVLGTGAALASSAYLLSAGAITLGSIYVVFRYTGMLGQPVQRLTRHMNSFLQASGAMGRVGELLERQPRICQGSIEALPRGPLSLALEDVSFAYEGEPVLRNVSLRLEAGKTLGLLGRTGSGKTTISRLVFRLHDVNQGVVRIGGLDVRDVRVDVLRNAVGLVTQNVQLFQGTLRDNVALFDPHVSDEQVCAAFAQLDLLDWVNVLPDGLHTQLGAGARGLSAGEAQLVALARVFLKDPGLVVLDEASSRLDPRTEELLEHAIARLLDGRSGVIIAHRMATLSRVDSIVVLEDGRVIERGARAELASMPESRFATLVRAGLQEALA